MLAAVEEAVRKEEPGKGQEASRYLHDAVLGPECCSGGQK